MLLKTMVALLVFSPGQMNDEFYQDFRGGTSIHPALVQFGAGPAGTIRQEAEGLCITLPSNRKDRSAVGVSPRFCLSGDFEVTVAYEVVSAEEPSRGPGAGIKIWGKLGSEPFQALTVAHLIRPKEGAGFVAIHGHERGGKRRFKTEWLPTAAKKGRLRLARTGSEVSFLAAEGEAETFQEIQRVQVGTSDVTSLRIPVTTEEAPSGLCVRLVDLCIRADDLPAARAQVRKGRAWGCVVVCGLVVAISGAGGFVLWQRHRRGAAGKRS